MVYKLLKSALVLSLATTSVECVFASMEYVNSQLCNKMDDEWLNDHHITFLERDIFKTICNDVILVHFLQMKDMFFVYSADLIIFL